MSPISPLRQQMIRIMQVRRFAPKTQESYLRVMSELSQHYNQSLRHLNDKQLYDYLIYLGLDRKLSWSSCHVAASAMMFFYNHVLRDRKIGLKVPIRKTPRRLPEILSLEETKDLVNCPVNEKHRIFLKTVYSAGLRLNEATHLRVKDIDSSRMTIRVEQGKGLKDRYTILSKK